MACMRAATRLVEQKLIWPVFVEILVAYDTPTSASQDRSEQGGRMQSQDRSEQGGRMHHMAQLQVAWHMLGCVDVRIPGTGRSNAFSSTSNVPSAADPPSMHACSWSTPTRFSLDLASLRSKLAATTITRLILGFIFLLLLGTYR
jgi:hypothetical protein